MSVLVSAITGGVFGAVGGGIGALIGTAFKSDAAKRRAVWISAAVAVVASRSVAQNIVEPQLAANSLESQLQQVPTLAVAKQYYPADYARLRDAARTAVQNGQSPVDAANTVRGQLQPIVAQALPHADVDNTLAMLRLVRDEAVSLKSHSAEDCGRFLAGVPTSLDLSKVFSSELQARDLQSTTAMLQQAATAPYQWTARANNGQLQRIALQALNRVPNAEQGSVVQWLATGGKSQNYEAQCSYTIALFDEIISHPKAEAASEFHAVNAAGT